MTFGFVECGSLVAWMVFVFIRMGPRSEQKKKEKKMWQHMVGRMLRFIMSVLLVVTIFYFTHDGAAADSWQIATGFALFVVHVLLTKSMCYMYRTARTPMFGVYLALVVATAGVMFVPMCVDPPGSLWIVNVVCFAVYTALLVIKSAYKVYRRMYSRSKDGMTSSELRRSLMQKKEEL